MFHIKKKLLIPTFVLLLTSGAFAYISGCGAVTAALPVVRSVVEIARLLCENAASEQPVDVLQGRTAQDFCSQERNLRPFVDGLLRAKKAAAMKAGLPQ